MSKKSETVGAPKRKSRTRSRSFETAARSTRPRQGYHRMQKDRE
jgi:hypothetical protein